MRLLILFCSAALISCGPTEPGAVPPVPPDLLDPEPGWQGPTPRDRRTLIRAAAAEQTGREAANAKLLAIECILYPEEAVGCP